MTKRTPPSWPDILDGAIRLCLKIGESVEVILHPHGAPLPEGYAPVDSGVVDCHMKHYRRIIAPLSHVEHCGEGEW